MTMEKITKKEAFECAISQIIAINGALNRQDISIYDYALILYKGSLSSIECLKPGNTFKWKNLNKGEYGQKAYAFLPIPPHYLSLIINECGSADEEIVVFEKFAAFEHPCTWIKDALSKMVLKASYFTGIIIENELVYETKISQKKHTTWIHYKDGDFNMYFPYYSSKQRKKLLSSIPQNDLDTIYKDYWYD